MNKLRNVGVFTKELIRDHYSWCMKRIKDTDTLEGLTRLETSHDRLYCVGAITSTQLTRLDEAVLKRRIELEG